MDFEALFDKRMKPPWIPEIENIPLINENIKSSGTTKVKGMIINENEVGL